MKKFYRNHWPLFLIGAFAIYLFLLVYLALNIELSTLQAVLISAGGPSVIMLTFGTDAFGTGWKQLFKPIVKLYNHITKRGMYQINDVYFYPGTPLNEFTIAEAKSIFLAMFQLNYNHPIYRSRLFTIPIVFREFPDTCAEKIHAENLNELSKDMHKRIFQTLCGYNEIRRLKELRCFRYGGL